MGCCTARESTTATLELQFPPFKKHGHRILKDVPEKLLNSVLAAVREAE